LAHAESIDIQMAFDLLTAIQPQERTFVVWQTAVRQLNKFAQLFNQRAIYGNYKVINS